MKDFLTFDDVLIVPQFSELKSRSEASTKTNLNGLELDLPVISSNMDTVTERAMCFAMDNAGGVGCFHRFMDIEAQKKIVDVENMPMKTIFSFGLGENERSRVHMLHDKERNYSNFNNFCLDVAHGAQLQVVDQVEWFKKQYPKAWLMVGNFASCTSLDKFLRACVARGCLPSAIKVGIGPGSACTTRIKTGVGIPQLSAIMECSKIADAFGVSVVADGGMKTSGDIAKALAAGADVVMLGGMLAGTDEAPGKLLYNSYHSGPIPKEEFLPRRKNKRGEFELVEDYSMLEPERLVKSYRGSASKESYKDQNKDWATAEGESFTVPYKGSVSDILADIKGGLQSAMSYVGARNLTEFRNNANFIKVSNNSLKESGAHGKRT